MNAQVLHANWSFRTQLQSMTSRVARTMLHRIATLRVEPFFSTMVPTLELALMINNALAGPSEFIVQTPQRE